MLYIYAIEMNLTILSTNQVSVLWLTALYREFLSIDWYAGYKEIFSWGLFDCASSSWNNVKFQLDAIR